MRKQRTRAEWVALCKELEKSSEGIATFAERNDVHRKTLEWWRSKLRREEEPQLKGEHFVEVIKWNGETAPGSAIVTVGGVTITCHSMLPPVEWVAELARRC